jgi:hypothetical protein
MLIEALIALCPVAFFAEVMHVVDDALDAVHVIGAFVFKGNILPD